MTSELDLDWNKSFISMISCTIQHIRIKKKIGWGSTGIHDYGGRGTFKHLVHAHNYFQVNKMGCQKAIDALSVGNCNQPHYRLLTEY